MLLFFPCLSGASFTQGYMDHLVHKMPQRRVGAVDGADSDVLKANCGVLQILCTGEVDFCTKDFQQWDWRFTMIQA